MKSECVVAIRRGREKPILAGHPWIFSGAVKEVTGYRKAGELCTVTDEKGRFLAKGYVNTNSAITVRVLTREPVAIDAFFFTAALRSALSLRENVLGGRGFAGASCAFRLVNAEGDFLPGLIVDRYGRGLVIQPLTAGMQKLKGLLLDALIALLNPTFIYEKIDHQSAAPEGVNTADGCLHGRVQSPLVIDEEGARFSVDIPKGQKTGFYLDQRLNRAIVKGIAAGSEVLNCFSYTGGFGVQAMLGGARRVVNVDTSDAALEGAGENARLNGIDPARFELSKEDVFTYLRRDERLYDIVVVDPPKFAGSRSELIGAARGYKDINLNGFKRVKTEGFMATFSCSGLVSEDLFQKIVFGAASDAGRRVQILGKLHADADHPVNLAHREGGYLKGLLLRVS